MRDYAQTNLQLFNQLQAEGYSPQDRQKVSEAYGFAVRLFCGLSLPSGKIFIDHLVGTASVLASLHVRVEVVIAGLIHAAYLHGNYGSTKKGITPSKRKIVRDAVGATVEELVARYEEMTWAADNIMELRGNLDSLGPTDRDALLMRLANQLDHDLDLGSLYCAVWQDWYRRHIENYGPIMVEIAENLGFPSLSADLIAVFRQITSQQMLPEPRMTGTQPAAYLIIPLSYRERLGLMFHSKARNASLKCLNRMRGMYRRVVRLKRRIQKSIEDRISRVASP